MAPKQEMAGTADVRAKVENEGSEFLFFAHCE
jgi:hypothetical protein